MIREFILNHFQIFESPDGRAWRPSIPSLMSHLNKYQAFRMLTLLTDFCFFYMCTKHCQLIVRSPFPIVEGCVCVSACLCLCEWVGDSYEGSLEEGKGRDTTRIPEKGSGCHKIRERLRGNWKSGVGDKGKGEEFWWTFRCHKHPVLPYFLGTWSFTSRLLSFR